MPGFDAALGQQTQWLQATQDWDQPEHEVVDDDCC